MINTPYPTQFATPLAVLSAVLPSSQALTTHRTYEGADFLPLLHQFNPISLDEMASVALLNRTDTKFVLSQHRLYEALTALTTEYRVLDINRIRLNHYQTLYFDTADFALYMSHHAGKRLRYKVRSREYVDTRLTFLEVKAKTGNNRTVKNRIQTPNLVTQFTSDTGKFINTHFPLNPYSLEPKLWNCFSRITLVNEQSLERLTLDMNLQFSNENDAVFLPGVAIAEVKQGNAHHASDFIRQMRAMNIHPTGFSKYCIGVSMLYPEVKHNNFKPKLRLVDQLIQGNQYVN